MKKKSTVFLACIGALLHFCSFAEAATITAASCSKSNVESAIAQAASGDTIQVPAGSSTWADYITVSKKLAIIGAGAGQTAISGPGFRIGNGTDGVRISGFSFSSTSVSTAIYAGASRSSTGSRNFRIDNCRFTGYAAWIQVDGHCTGVIDNNEFFKCTGEGIYVFGDDEAAWTRDSGLGTSDFVFIEHNLFDTQGTLNGHFILANFGGRPVIRYNTFKESGGARSNDFIDMHGYCHGSYDRGTRAFEIYENTFIRDTNGCCRCLFLRGGTGVVYTNTFDESGGGFYWNSIKTPVFMVDYRASKWDGTKTVCSSTCSKSYWCDSGEGHPCCDQIGRGKDKCSQSSPCGQADEPVYFWNNKLHTGAATPLVVHSGSAAYIKEGVDYYTTQKPGYVPYAYPHPLVSGSTATTTTVVGPPAPPTNFRVVPSQ